MMLMVSLIANYFWLIASGRLPTTDCGFFDGFLLIAKVRRVGVDPSLPFVQQRRAK
jgi:hypothetical protein